MTSFFTAELTLKVKTTCAGIYVERSVQSFSHSTRYETCLHMPHPNATLANSPKHHQPQTTPYLSRCPQSLQIKIRHLHPCNDLTSSSVSSARPSSTLPTRRLRRLLSVFATRSVTSLVKTYSTANTKKARVPSPGRWTDAKMRETRLLLRLKAYSVLLAASSPCLGRPKSFLTRGMNEALVWSVSQRCNHALIRQTNSHNTPNKNPPPPPSLPFPRHLPNQSLQPSQPMQHLSRLQPRPAVHLSRRLATTSKSNLSNPIDTTAIMVLLLLVDHGLLPPHSQQLPEG